MASAIFTVPVRRFCHAIERIDHILDFVVAFHRDFVIEVATRNGIGETSGARHSAADANRDPRPRVDRRDQCRDKHDGYQRHSGRFVLARSIGLGVVEALLVDIDRLLERGAGAGQRASFADPIDSSTA